MYSFYCRMYCCSSFLVFLKHTYFFTRAGAGAGAGQKKTGAGQKWTGSATLLVWLLVSENIDINDRFICT